MDALICSGARRGRQFTYALLDERVPGSNKLTQDEATAMLTSRYFGSHGSATARDFAWWSGMTLAQARHGIEIIHGELQNQEIDGQRYWALKASEAVDGKGRSIYLLPCFDEYTVGYTDRNLFFDPAHKSLLDIRGQVINQYVTILRGCISGTWSRSMKKDTVVIRPIQFLKMSESQWRSFARAARGYAKFLKKKLVPSM